MNCSQVLVLDFNEYLSRSSQAQSRFIEGIGQSLQQSGFVVCQNLGITEVMRKVRVQERLFFETVPLEEKLKLFCPETKGERGFVPIGGETAIGQGFPDLKEYFEFGREGDRCYDVNVWPEEDVLPQFKRTMLEMYTIQEQRLHTLLEALAQYLGLSPSELKDDATGGNSVMRLNFYPTKEYILKTLRGYIDEPMKAHIHTEIAQEMEEALRKRDAKPKSVRAGAHKDSNFITLLYEPGEGLQVNINGEWKDILYLNESTVINIGQKLELKTGLPATIHRVVNPRLDFSVSRYTEPFFGHPHADCILDVKTGLTDRQYMDTLLIQRYTAGK